MTQLRTIDTATLAGLSKALVGFDRYFNMPVPQGGSYPPHNIVKYGNDYYGIEVAVAGFSKEEITVDVDQDQLTIRGVKAHPNPEVEYLHRGLAARNFELFFTLAEYMEIKGASVSDGLLQIDIERIVPDALKPRSIEVK